MIKLLFSLFIIFFIILKFNKVKLNLIIYYNLIFLFFFRFILLFIFNYRSLYWIILYNWIGLDCRRLILLILSFWIVILIFIVSLNNKKNINYYIFILLILLIFLSLRFIRINYFIFYLFFEISLIPTFLLILGWGYQSERLNAGIFMILYTIFSSLPLLLIINYLYNYFNSLNYLFIFLFRLIFNINNFIIYFFIFFAFLVKLPIYIFHMWLPKAHVEAPVSGSIILAGVILKLGGYGIIRSIIIIINICIYFNYIFIIISLYGILLIRLVCLRQFDLKVLVAYSSVVHISIILIGLLRLNLWGLIGGLILIIGHGLCSSGLFVLVNIIYDRRKSRNLIFNKGIIYIFPIFSFFFFFFFFFLYN